MPWSFCFRIENPSVWQIPMFSQNFPMRNMDILCVEFLSSYSLDMTRTVFFQRFKLDISSISPQQSVAEHWDLPNTEIFQSKDVASDMCIYKLT
jgi:hypothetical protein